MSDKNFTFNFNGPVGQNIANVERMEVYMDKDGQIQVMNTEQVTAASEQPQEQPQEQPNTGITDGTIEQHLQLFKEAMLKAQEIKQNKDSYRFLMSNTYDWVAAERLGKDWGVLKNYDQLVEILQDKRFREVPKNSQNLTKYRAYIDPNTRYPNWQCSNMDADGFFRKFKQIADNIFSIYTLACRRDHIKPYGTL